MDILCKTLPETVPENCLTKIILRVPYVLEFKIPLVYKAKFKLNPSPLTDELFKRQVFRYFKQGTVETNHQLVTLESFLATTEEDAQYFENLNRATHCLVDYKLFAEPFYDFCVQNSIYIHNTLSLKDLKFEYSQHKLLHNRSYSYFLQKIGSPKYAMKVRSHVLILTLHMNPHQSYTSQRDCISYRDSILEIWSKLTTLQTGGPLQTNFPLVLGVYDIEAGVAEANAHKFTTPITGYVQMIGLSIVEQIGLINLNKSKHLLLVLKCPNFNYVKIRKAIENVFMHTIERLNGGIEICYFDSELDMLKYFLGLLLPQIDILNGYNSDQFDLPFLVTRCKLLENFTKTLGSAIQSFYLLDGNQPVKLVVQTKQIYTFQIKCKWCAGIILLSRCTNQNFTLESGVACAHCFKVIKSLWFVMIVCL